MPRATRIWPGDTPRLWLPVRSRMHLHRARLALPCAAAWIGSARLGAAPGCGARENATTRACDAGLASPLSVKRRIAIGRRRHLHDPPAEDHSAWESISGGSEPARFTRVDVPRIPRTRTPRFTIDEWDAAIQHQHGSISFADRKGEARGLRLGIETACEMAGIDLSAEHQYELRKLAVGH